LILQYHSIEVGVQEEGRRKKKIIFPSAPPLLCPLPQLTYSTNQKCYFVA
jgi:hypothetical protein